MRHVVICVQMGVALTGGVPKLREIILDLGVWAAPGDREPLKKVGGFAPRLFEGFPATRG